MSGELLVFLGPSLAANAARAIAPCTVLPPAAQGDVWTALRRRPRAIALIDGVFEARPSVWHQELLAALDAGVAVFGASSMGALRAAELAGHGVIGVGHIYEAYRDGWLVDDAEVALLHADAEHGFRPLTVPLVNVRHAAVRAAKEGVVSRRDALRIVEMAEGVFYQERTWPRVLDGARLPSAVRARLEEWLAQAPVDLKAEDARECLRAAGAFMAGGGRLPVAARPRAFSSAVRQRRMLQAGELGEAGREEEAERGVSRALLAAWARSLGMCAAPAEVVQMEAAWLEAQGVGSREREAFLARRGLDDAQLRRLCEDRVLQLRMLSAAPWLVPDGPSVNEGLALERSWAPRPARATRRPR
ncbi:MAG: hypothetical protein L0Y64_24430 [Myxococcaceae bacterium]|nr:hypothetical protein [Myxococcaceae bacterium]